MSRDCAVLSLREGTPRPGRSVHTPSERTRMETSPAPTRATAGASPSTPDSPTPSARWALAGLGAGLAGLGAGVASGMVDAVYDRSLVGDTSAVAAKLAEQVPQMLAFHVLGVAAAVLLIVFAAGLHRRLAATSPAGSLSPALAAAGLFGTGVVLVLGTALDTEFIFAFGEPGLVDPANAAMFNHWIGTVPWCWVLLGLTGLALFAASRNGGVPRWLGLVSLAGGALTLLIGVSPLQYMASFTGQVGTLVIALGFLLGDRKFRGRA